MARLLIGPRASSPLMSAQDARGPPKHDAPLEWRAPSKNELTKRITPETSTSGLLSITMRRSHYEPTGGDDAVAFSGSPCRSSPRRVVRPPATAGRDRAAAGHLARAG